MNRRELFGKIVAAAGGLGLGTALEVAARVPLPPTQEGDPHHFLQQWEAVRPPLTPAEEAVERAMIAATYLVDAIEEVEHLHDLAHPQAHCDCDRCYDSRGWQYLMNGPWSIWQNEHVGTVNASRWEDALEQRREVRKKEREDYLERVA